MITLRVLQPVPRFQITFNYGAKGVKDVGPIDRNHQSNVMLDRIFSVNIAQCIICLFFFFLFRCDILASFYSQRQGAQFYQYYISGLEETLSCNRQSQIGLISLELCLLFGTLLVDFKQQISFGSSSAVCGILSLGQGCYSFNQYNLQDRML